LTVIEFIDVQAEGFRSNCGNIEAFTEVNVCNYPDLVMNKNCETLFLIDLGQIVSLSCRIETPAQD
jgi:hypothetical protein